MASFSSFFLPLSVLLLVLVISPTVLSESCKSQKFSTPKKSFATCTDLPHLSASLHYTFDPAASTLSMAFTAPPPKAGGWVAWAINPTATGMAGSQALLAYKSANGSVAVNTLNILSYSSITPSPLSIKVSDIAGESSADTITIFATWHLDPKTTSINQVWQVGPSVNGGIPTKHAFAQENLLAKSKLQLTSAKSAAPAEAPSAGAPGSTSQAGNATAAAASAPAPASGKNAAGEGLLGFNRFGAGLALVLMAAFGLLF